MNLSALVRVFTNEEVQRREIWNKSAEIDLSAWRGYTVATKRRPRRWALRWEVLVGLADAMGLIRRTSER